MDRHSILQPFLECEPALLPLPLNAIHRRLYRALPFCPDPRRRSFTARFFRANDKDFFLSRGTTGVTRSAQGPPARIRCEHSPAEGRGVTPTLKVVYIPTSVIVPSRAKNFAGDLGIDLSSTCRYGIRGSRMRTALNAAIPGPPILTGRGSSIALRSRLTCMIVMASRPPASALSRLPLAAPIPPLSLSAAPLQASHRACQSCQPQLCRSAYPRRC